ncbi:hypothetical protein D9M72_611360 [compost metagenome]
MADAVAAAALRHQVRRIGHALHAAGNGDIERARDQPVVDGHGRAHARAAHLVDGGTAHAQRQARAQRGLARRGLALAGRQHAAEHHFFHLLGLQAGALYGGADGHGAQLGRGDAGEFALERSHRRAGG